MPEHQCSSHGMFEKMIQQSIDNLADKVSEGIRAFSAQSASNGEMLKQVLDNQAARKELCGRQSVKIENHEEQLEGLWAACNAMQRRVWIGVGVIGTVQVVVVPLVVWLINGGGQK